MLEYLIIYVNTIEDTFRRWVINTLFIRHILRCIYYTFTVQWTYLHNYKGQPK